MNYCQVQQQSMNYGRTSVTVGVRLGRLLRRIAGSYMTREWDCSSYNCSYVSLCGAHRMDELQSRTTFVNLIRM